MVFMNNYAIIIKKNCRKIEPSFYLNLKNFWLRAWYQRFLLNIIVKKDASFWIKN